MERSEPSHTVKGKLIAQESNGACTLDHGVDIFEYTQPLAEDGTVIEMPCGCTLTLARQATRPPCATCGTSFGGVVATWNVERGRAA